MQLHSVCTKPDYQYMRTDSVNLSKDAMEAAQAEIIKSYGKEFSKPRTFVNKSKGTRSHEAIRPRICPVIR
jgi:DNA topoisomerase-1